MRLMLPLSLCVGLTLSPVASAGWGDILKEVEKTGHELLQGTSETPARSSETRTDLSQDQLVKGLREALRLGSVRAIDALSKRNGYLGNPEVRIPLPPELQQVERLLAATGLNQQAEAFKVSMNRAAESAAPAAQGMLVNAVSEISLDEAREIYQGQPDAATRYLESKTRSQLADLFKPRIQEALANNQTTALYTALTREAKNMPVVGSLGLNALNLDEYVTSRALDGVFTMLAEQEKQIRQDPLARTTDLLKTLFGQP